MTEKEAIMSDKELKLRMFNQGKDTFDDHAAAVAAFCVMNDLSLEKGYELAIEILGDELTILLKNGTYDEAVKNLEKIKREAESELMKLQSKMREAADE